MKRSLPLLFILMQVLFLGSCTPINIFSPFVDPSRMGNEAKMEAGYNAIESGNYDSALQYFSDVIAGSSGGLQADAYIGRGSTHLNIASPEIGSVVGSLISGSLSVDNPSAIIQQVVQDGDFTGFFDEARLAADDFNAAVGIIGAGADPGILLETYQVNMMAATGVGALRIATGYNVPPWDTAPLDDEYNAILDELGAYPYNISTWDNAVGNGLAAYVDGAPEETEMLSYLSAAFGALELLRPAPPAGMSEADVLDMENNIIEWVQSGLGVLTPWPWP